MLVVGEQMSKRGGQVQQGNYCALGPKRSAQRGTGGEPESAWLSVASIVSYGLHSQHDAYPGINLHIEAMGTTYGARSVIAPAPPPIEQRSVRTQLRPARQKLQPETNSKLSCNSAETGGKVSLQGPGRARLPERIRWPTLLAYEVPSLVCDD